MENVKDLQDIPENVKNHLEIVPVRWIDQVLEFALESMPVPLPDDERRECVTDVIAEVGCLAERCGGGWRGIWHGSITGRGRHGCDRMRAAGR